MQWKHVTAAMSAMALVTQALSPRLAAQDRGAEQAVTQRVSDYFASMGSGKLEGIAAYLADDYLVIGGDGKLETRAERLAWLRENLGNVAALTPREVRVRSYGSTAVATGLVVIPQDAPAAPIEERFTQVWVQRRGAWQLVSAQITIVRK